jgi:hypothetical protein
MNKTNLIFMSVLFLALGLSSCTTSENKKKSSIGEVSLDTAETATKPLTTTASVVKDSVIGVNTVMKKVMKDVNAAIALPVPDADKIELKDKETETEIIKEKPVSTDK